MPLVTYSVLRSGPTPAILSREEFAVQTATVQEVQARLPELLREVGAGGEVVIISDGKPVGRLVPPPPPPKGVPVAGRGKGKLIIHSDDDEHLKDFAEYVP